MGRIIPFLVDILASLTKSMISRCSRLKYGWSNTNTTMHSLHEVCYQYWPAGKRTQSYGEFSVELVNEERKRGFILRTLSVQQAKVHKRRTRGDLVDVGLYIH